MDDTPTGTAAVSSGASTLAVRFTGSGSEYFRIWIVNLLLTIVTLSLYHPWAKVRRLRYFHGNTLVGGRPLGYHADPRKMLRGYLLVVLMALLYSVAGNFSALAGLVAFVIVAAIWPALIMSSMRFRLANTSWRGMRFRFRGSLRGAYAAWLPALAPLLLITAAGAAVPDRDDPPAWYGVLMLGVIGVAVALIPWLWWNLKKYQHDHYAFGAEQTTLHAGKASFYKVFHKTGGVALLGLFGLVALVIAAAVATGLSWPRLPDLPHEPGRLLGLSFVLMLGVPLALIVLQLLPRAYFVSRMQNLLWSSTASPAVRFRSELRFWPLLRLMLKNWLLMIVTLGLYWPFAAVATARLRLDAMQVELLVDPALLSDAQRAEPGDAVGDAAGDVFDIDIGL